MKVKKSGIIVFLLVIEFIIGCASADKFSSSTKILLNEYNKAKQMADKTENKITLPEKIVDDYALKIADDEYVARAFIKLNESLNENDLLNLGATINSRIGDTWTITIPLNKIEKLAEINGIEQIEINIKSNIR